MEATKKTSSLTTLICLTWAQNTLLNTTVLMDHFNTQPSHTPHCPVTQHREALWKDPSAPSLVSLPSHTSQLAVDPLFLSGPEYRWMTVLPHMPRLLSLTNLAAFPFVWAVRNVLLSGLILSLSSSDIFDMLVNLSFFSGHFVYVLQICNGAKVNNCFVT